MCTHKHTHLRIRTHIRTRIFIGTRTNRDLIITEPPRCHVSNEEVVFHFCFQSRTYILTNNIDVFLTIHTFVLSVRVQELYEHGIRVRNW